MILALLLTACTEPTAGPLAVFNPAGGFFDTPWPSDARADADGHADWTGFPNPTALPLLDTFLDRASQTAGAATNAAMYLKFDRPIPWERLPGPAASMSATSPLQLVDVDPRSPTFGQRVPVRFEPSSEGGAYIDADVVPVAPEAGWPLRPGTTYALLVTTVLARPDARFEAALRDGGDGSAWAEALAPLRAALPVLELRERDIAVATVFTTQRPTDDMGRVARFLEERVTPPVLGPEVVFQQDIGDYRVWRLDTTTPMFMSGEPPWADEGGAFVWRDDGLPVVQRWEPMRISVVTPVDLSAPPEGGWPVLVSLHGTGGHWRSFANSSSEFEIGQWMAGLGMVGVSFDLPLHGAREAPGTAIDLHSFNVLQPDSATHIHRQGAADLLYLLRGLRAGPTFVLDDGTEVPINPDRVVVIGHSQGGITTALAAPWLGKDVQGAVMSGTGGLLAITAVERDNDYDFPAIIRGLLQMEEAEPLTELHPVLGLVQSLVEVTDPINYARFWHQEPVDAGEAPLNALLTTGLRDDMTPFRTAEALGAAAGLPWAGPRYTAAPGSILHELPTLRLPVQDDVVGFDDALHTSAVSQWDAGTHFVIFEDEDARDVVRQFVYGASQGAPIIDDGVPDLGDATP